MNRSLYNLSNSLQNRLNRKDHIACLFKVHFNITFFFKIFLWGMKEQTSYFNGIKYYTKIFL